MAQIFHRSTNTLSKLSIFGALFLIGALIWVLLEANRSYYYTQAFVAREQPVQFSHKHHVGDDGIDCRYCHTSVETSSFAGIPPPKTCMNCHSQILARTWSPCARVGEPANRSRGSESMTYLTLSISTIAFT